MPPWEKPKSGKFPAVDPLSFAMPLFDAYAGPVRNSTKDDARLNPILMDINDLPNHVLFFVAGIDILTHEELAFIDRLQRDAQSETTAVNRKYDAIVFDRGFHGWLECKRIALLTALHYADIRSTLVAH